MTRDEKLEAMARAWCEFHGWVPDHRPLVLKHDEDGVFFEADGEPIWKAHVKAMDVILRGDRAIGGPVMEYAECPVCGKSLYGGDDIVRIVPPLSSRGYLYHLRCLAAQAFDENKAEEIVKRMIDTVREHRRR